MSLKLAKAFAVACLPFLAGCGGAPATAPLDSGQAYRSLTKGEIELAKTIFGSQINYNDVQVYKQARGRDRSRHVSGDLYMGHVKYAPDYSKESDLLKRVTYIHELAHVWQYQSGQDMRARSIDEFLTVGAGNDRYKIDWGDVHNFPKASLEQQAKIVQMHFHMSAFTAQEGDAKFCDDIARLQQNLKPHFPAITIPAATAKVCG